MVISPVITGSPVTHLYFLCPPLKLANLGITQEPLGYISDPHQKSSIGCNLSLCLYFFDSDFCLSSRDSPDKCAL